MLIWHESSGLDGQEPSSKIMNTIIIIIIIIIIVIIIILLLLHLCLLSE